MQPMTLAILLVTVFVLGYLVVALLYPGKW